MKSPSKFFFEALTNRCDVRIPDILTEVLHVCSHTFWPHKYMPNLLITRNLANTLQEEFLTAV